MNRLGLIVSNDNSVCNQNLNNPRIYILIDFHHSILFAKFDTSETRPMQEQQELKILLSRLSENDEEAFKELFNTYCHRVNAFALKLTRTAALAEETVQDVFMKIWVSRKTLTSVDNFQSYLFAIVRNHVYNKLKRMALEEKAKVIFRNELLLEIEAKQEEQEIVEARKQLLQQVVDAMPRQQRMVYDLCHREGLKYEEAAVKLNISRLTVKTHMQHALRAIRLHFHRAFIPVLSSILMAL